MADIKLAQADLIEGSIFPSYSGFYMPDRLNQYNGLSPEKLQVPTDYHSMLKMIWEFYIRGGMATIVINRMAELTTTELRNSRRNTSKEAKVYFEAVLHRKPSQLYRFIRTMALEYFLTGMVVPRVEWKTVKGSDLHPDLTPGKEYVVPTFDLYPSNLINIEWIGWGQKQFYLNISKSDLDILKGKRKTTQQVSRFNLLNQYPMILDAFTNGSNRIPLTDVDPILRKETSLSPYPIPYMSSVLETLVFKQQLRRMDFAVASRIINAILLVQEGDKDFPQVDGEHSNLDELKKQILARSNNAILQERLFTLFSNHTTKLTWITPDVTALLDQEKYRQANEEVMEGLGFPRILVVGESRGAQAAEVSTWAIQPQMEELRTMLLEWIQPVYDMAADNNSFRNTPQASFTPIKLQDFIKTAAVFAQAYREGNVSRTTRDQIIGLDFENEVDLMADELDLMKELPKDFPEMPYNTQLPPNNAVGIGANNQGTKTGGKKPGTTNTAVNKKNSGVRLTGQQPVTRTAPSDKPASSRRSQSELEGIELWTDEEVIEALDKEAQRRGIQVTLG